MMVKASSIQGWTHAFSTASLCRDASTCSFSDLAYCIHAGLWVTTTIYAIPQKFSYFCWSSHAFVSKRWMLGSSCEVMRTSSDSSNMLVESRTAPLISSNLIMIVLAHCSLTSEAVDSCAFNRSSVIWRFNSSWTFVISSLASWTHVANLWIHASTGISARMSSSEMHWQALSITYTSCWFCDTNSSCYKLSCSIFIFYSLRTWSTRLSLALSSAVIQSCNTYNVSCGRVAILTQRLFSMLTKGFSASFDVISAPFSSTILFVIRTRNICSIVMDPTVRLVERVPTWGEHTCKSCNCALRAPNTIWFSCIKSWRASLVTSCNILLMSCRSPSVRVIGSMDNFEALTLFRNPTCSTGCWHFIYVDAVHGFASPSISTSSLPASARALFGLHPPLQLLPMLLWSFPTRLLSMSHPVLPVLLLLLFPSFVFQPTMWCIAWPCLSSFVLPTSRFLQCLGHTILVAMPPGHWKWHRQWLKRVAFSTI